MGSPSHPSSPREQAGPAQPGTAEIPVVRPAAAPVTKQLPPHPGATSFGAQSFGAQSLGAQPTTAVQQPQPQAPAQPTGPVDFVPGIPGLSTPPPPPPAAAPSPAAPAATWPESLEAEDPPQEGGGRRLRLPQERGALVPIGLAVLAVALLQLGLALELGSDPFWDVVPLWSAFATAACLAGVVGLVLAATKGGRPRRDGWRAGAAGLVGLSVFWLLVGLPVADGDRGFLLTAALGCLGAALWIGAERD